MCEMKHPTCLHKNHGDGGKDRQIDKREESGKKIKEKELPKEWTESKQSNEITNEATSNHVVQDMNSTYSSTVMLVWLSKTNNPENEVLVYVSTYYG